MADDGRPAEPTPGPDDLSAGATLMMREAVGRLATLADLCPDTLTKDEYDGERSSVFAELADGQHPESVLVTVGGLFAVSGGVGAVCCWAAGWPVLAVFLTVEAVVGAFLGLLAARSWRVKRRLTVEDRLEVVAELARRQLITPDEAASLRERIGQLGHDRPGLHRS